MLTGKQRRNLRALGHNLQALVQIGKGGVDDGLVAAVNQALADHELIKIKLGSEAPLDRDEAATAVAARTKSDVAQILGRTILLFRPDPKDPRINPTTGEIAERPPAPKAPPRSAKSKLARPKAKRPWAKVKG